MDRETVGRPMEILLVEDSLTSARLTMGALKKGDFQHRLTWLKDGDEAIEFVDRRGKYVRAPRPDLILLDLGLPKKDGRQVLQEIRSDDGVKKIPIVVLTASTDHQDQVNSERLQVDGYMTKPVDMEQFLRLIADLKTYWMAEVILPSVD